MDEIMAQKARETAKSGDRTSGKLKVARFHGPKANVTKSDPPSGTTETPFKSMINARWAGAARFRVAEDLKGLDSSSLSIPDSAFNAADLATMRAE
jgi:hypothetical protein